MLYEFKGHRPVVDPSAFIHPQSAVTGNVWIGKNVYVGPGAAIRGDWGGIIIEDGCNVQENCTIHMFPGVTVLLKEGAHLGHGAIVHGAVIGRNCLIGMNSVVMDNVEIGDECIIGALSFIKTGEKIPRRSVVAGNPAKILKEVSDEMLQWKTEGTALYQALPDEIKTSWRPIGERDMEWPKRWEAITEYIHIGDHPMVKTHKPWKDVSEWSGKNIAREPEAEFNSGREYSLEDYLDVEKHSGMRHEFYQGTIFAMAGGSMEHNRIVFNLTVLLGRKMWGKSCNIFGSDQRVHIVSNSLYTYPDLTIVCGQPVIAEKDKMSLTNPAAIIEVLSPTTKNYDRTTKFTLYKDISTLQEYILIDPQPYLVEHWQKNEKKGWVLRTFDQPTDHFPIRTIDVRVPLEGVYRNIQLMKKV